MQNEKMITLRDELKLKAHLFDSEMKYRWERFEKDWNLVRSEMKRIMPKAQQALRESSLATKPLLTEINESLQRIEDGFERHHS